ncbi:PDDEXK nuclease domain-containing protein [Neorhodopirellula lusitana]|uniref:PDDEXK nuclease domain-containing protein n=1 Tax=Neorhodopirellula lusitana TaxID=445327 RepID=UPI0024B7401F|nr:PDDEXK nuclease domain-containing protein [Neorhodopirellula lusitana]
MAQPESHLARQTLRTPYNFDFLTLTGRHSERELEDGLIDHLTKFLLEFGASFAFVGRRYNYSIDLRISSTCEAKLRTRLVKTEQAASCPKLSRRRPPEHQKPKCKGGLVAQTKAPSHKCLEMSASDRGQRNPESRV